MHKTSAWPLALIYAGLIVYASLFPFDNWRDQGISFWLFLTAALPPYWTAFDVVANVLGYAPLGFFLILGSLRSGHSRYALGMAVLVPTLLSLLMESVQVYLPNRVPSNLDWLLNILGAVMGAASAWSLEKMGVLQRWIRFRQQWFVEDARGGLVLLWLWPLALLFPTSVPLGLGQVLGRMVSRLTELFANTPFLRVLDNLHLHWEQHPTLPAATEWLCVTLGLLTPCLLGYCIIISKTRRAWFLLWVLFFAIAGTALSASLSFAPEHAWVWLTAPVKAALLVGVALGLALIGVSALTGAALGLMALGVQLSLINQAATGAYFEQTLFLWEQGRFIRFHGLAQWLGWLWPFAAMAYLLTRLVDAQPEAGTNLKSRP